MENQRPLILISNDDGIIAKGISELIKFLRPLGEIVVMAPDAPRSGNAHSIRCSTANPTLWWAALITAITPRSMCIIPEQWVWLSKAA